MLTEIKTYNGRAVSFSFIWGLTKDYSLGNSIAVALRNCSKDVGEGNQYTCDFGKGVRTIKSTSW